MKIDPGRRRKMEKAINKRSEKKAAYLFVIPAVILLAAFLI